MKRTRNLSIRFLLLTALMSLAGAAQAGQGAGLPLNPLDRLLLRERMRVQILQKTHDLGEGSYRGVVDRLRLQLRQLGFRADEAEDILNRVQETRARGPW